MQGPRLTFSPNTYSIAPPSTDIDLEKEIETKNTDQQCKIFRISDEVVICPFYPDEPPKSIATTLRIAKNDKNCPLTIQRLTF